MSAELQMSLFFKYAEYKTGRSIFIQEYVFAFTSRILPRLTHTSWTSIISLLSRCTRVSLPNFGTSFKNERKTNYLFPFLLIFCIGYSSTSRSTTMHNDESKVKERDVINFNVSPGESAVMSPPSAILSSVIADL